MLIKDVIEAISLQGKAQDAASGNADERVGFFYEQGLEILDRTANDFNELDMQSRHDAHGVDHKCLIEIFASYLGQSALELDRARSGVLSKVAVVHDRTEDVKGELC